ncbi:MAG: NUDIX domain-containing protein [Phycisphaerae bacterium]|nr:NUDIX domain-containing protein [Phycisphaerae bacterium]
MPRQSAGLLMYRKRQGQIEVFLVHPGGPFWTGKDLGAWSIPKGEFTDEIPLDAARREFQEETGFIASGDFRPLQAIRQAGGKIVYAWAFEGDCDAEAARSSSFTMEYPPHSGRQASFPEVDRAAWFDLARARERILKSQAPLLDQLERLLEEPTWDA